MSAVTDPDPLAPLLARNVEHRAELLHRAGGNLSAEEAAQRLGIAPETVDEWRRAGTLLAISEGDDWRYPSCQFQQGEVVPGLAEVVRGLASEGPWVTLDILLAPDTVLAGRTPLQALQAGDCDAVLRLVRAGQSKASGEAAAANQGAWIDECRNRARIGGPASRLHLAQRCPIPFHIHSAGVAQQQIREAGLVVGA
jgi:hypothetical protein